MNETITIEPDDNGQRIDRWLKKRLPDVPFGQLQKWLRTGQIRINGKRAKPDTRLEKGQEIRLPPFATTVATPEQKNEKDKSFIRNLVIYQDDDVIALNKPAGLAVQGGSKITRHIDGMLRHLATKEGIKPRLVHRIDRDTSGVLLLAKSAESARRLTEAFAGRDIEKTYWAITVPAPEQDKGRIDAPLAKAMTGPDIEKMVVDEDTGKPSITDYEVLSRNDDGSAALTAFFPLTGRTHQIRVHAQVLKCPLLGDRKYGDPKGPDRLHLHARKISLIHPKSGKEFSIEAPVTDLFTESCRRLKLAIPG